MKRFGRADILFNNAGINIRKPPQEMTLAEWNEVLNANLTSAFLMSKAVYPAMKRQGGGKIVNIGSMTSIFGASFAPAYATSKGGIVQLTKSLALAWAAGQYPGQLDPAGLVRHRADGKGPGTDPGPSRTGPGADRPGPMGQAGRHGGDRDLARQPASDYVTGIAVPVDGGYTSTL